LFLPLFTNVVERLSEKVLSGVSIAHLGGTLRQKQGYFAPFFDSLGSKRKPTRLFGQSRKRCSRKFGCSIRHSASRVPDGHT
jgi:hypothetical protein